MRYYLTQCVIFFITFAGLFWLLVPKSYCKCGSSPPCLVQARVGDILTLYTDQSHTWHGQKGSSILLPFLRAEHACCLTAAILDFAKGAFFEANRGKTHTLNLYLPELLICLKGITEVVFYFVLVLRSKKDERRVKDGFKEATKTHCE